MNMHTPLSSLRRQQTRRQKPLEPSRYWVIGGQYQDTGFQHMTSAPLVSGPYKNRNDAYDEWRRLTAKTTAQALLRFCIAAE